MTANSNYIQKEKKSVMNDDNLIMQNLSDDELIIFNQWVFNVATPIVCSLSEKNKDKVQYNIDNRCRKSINGYYADMTK